MDSGRYLGGEVVSFKVCEELVEQSLGFHLSGNDGLSVGHDGGRNRRVIEKRKIGR